MLNVFALQTAVAHRRLELERALAAEAQVVQARTRDQSDALVAESQWKEVVTR